ncbi:MAG: alpha-glucosidase, partial [Phenylobacterium zucineum]
STLALYRQALALRAHLPALGDGELAWVDAGPDALAFTREPGFGCWVNVGTDPIPLPEGASVLLASAELVGGRLAPDSTAWLRLG